MSQQRICRWSGQRTSKFSPYSLEKISGSIPPLSHPCSSHILLEPRQVGGGEAGQSEVSDSRVLWLCYLVPLTRILLSRSVMEHTILFRVTPGFRNPQYSKN